MSGHDIQLIKFIEYFEKVLDAGEIAEVGVPHHLLQKSDGLFSKLVKQTGKNMSAKLKQLAKQYYLTKFDVNLEEKDSESEHD